MREEHIIMCAGDEKMSNGTEVINKGVCRNTESQIRSEGAI